jgi:flagellin-like hook-associated protein FlgL
MGMHNKKGTKTMSEISLTAGMKTSLQGLQNTQKLFLRTQEHMTTGKRVSTPMDDPANYFAAATLTDRSNDLEGRLDGMGQAVQAIKAADAGIGAIRSVLSNMKAVVENALTTTESDSNTRSAMGKKFNDLIVQLNGFANDSAYGGINLLKDEQTIEIQLGQRFDDSKFTVQGFHIAGAASTNSNNEVGAIALSDIPSTWGAAATTSVPLFAFALNKVEDPTTFVGIKSYGVDDTTASGHEVDWAGTDYKVTLKDTLKNIELVDEVLQTRSKLFTFDQSTITLREDYTKEFINTLGEGSDKLTLADLNEEAANLLSLQTSQQLGIQAMSLSNQRTQSVLSLLNG